MLEVMESSASPGQRLQEMGFRKCGEWRLEENRLKCTLVEHAAAQNVLYAFISDGAVLYIGKTVRSLRQRMCGYQNPGPTQSTNIKGNKLIREALTLGNSKAQTNRTAHEFHLSRSPHHLRYSS